MTQSIGRSYMFCAAHRIMGHEGKCKNLHGHTYTAEVVLSLRTSEHEGGPCTVDNLGRILDYSVMDEVFGTWIKDYLDHGAILSTSDPLVPILRKEGSRLIPCNLQPTAENIASMLYCTFSTLMNEPRFERVTLSRVIVRESPTSFAEVS